MVGGKHRVSEPVAQQRVGNALYANTRLSIIQREAVAVIVITAELPNELFGAAELLVIHTRRISHCRTPSYSPCAVHRPPKERWHHRFSRSFRSSSLSAGRGHFSKALGLPLLLHILEQVGRAVAGLRLLLLLGAFITLVYLALAVFRLLVLPAYRIFASRQSAPDWRAWRGSAPDGRKIPAARIRHGLPAARARNHRRGRPSAVQRILRNVVPARQHGGD